MAILPLRVPGVGSPKRGCSVRGVADPAASSQGSASNSTLGICFMFVGILPSVCHFLTRAGLSLAFAAFCSGVQPIKNWRGLQGRLLVRFGHIQVPVSATPGSAAFLVETETCSDGICAGLRRTSFCVGPDGGMARNGQLSRVCSANRRGGKSGRRAPRTHAESARSGRRLVVQFRTHPGNECSHRGLIDSVFHYSVVPGSAAPGRTRSALFLSHHSNGAVGLAYQRACSQSVNLAPNVVVGLFSLTPGAALTPVF